MKVPVHNVCLMVVASLCLGCSSASAPAKGLDNELKPLGILYMKYVGRHQGKSPGSREELENFIKSNGQDELKGMGISDTGAIFLSSRDGSPLIVRYGVQIPPPGPGGPSIVAYEAIGSNGRRFVANSMGGVEELDEATLKEKVPDFK